MIRTGLIGKILSKLISDPKDDHNYDHKPGESNTAKIANDKQKMFKEQRLKASPPPVNMNSPLDSYENPKFVDKQAGQAAINIASAQLLDGAIKKFNDPAEKSKRQQNRADRLTKRADAKKDRLNARADRRDKRGARKFDISKQDAKKGADQKPGEVTIDTSFDGAKTKFDERTAKIRAKGDTKKTELNKRAGEMQVKSDANKMIADERAKYAGLTANQIRLAKASEAKNPVTTKKVETSKGESMFANYDKYGFVPMSDRTGYDPKTQTASGYAPKPKNTIFKKYLKDD